MKRDRKQWLEDLRGMFDDNMIVIQNADHIGDPSLLHLKIAEQQNIMKKIVELESEEREEGLEPADKLAYENYVIRHLPSDKYFVTLRDNKGSKWTTDLGKAYYFDLRENADRFVIILSTHPDFCKINSEDLEIRQVEFTVQLKAKD